MPVSKLSYGSVTTITITLASLANATSATSSSIDNTVNLFLDADIEIVILSAASGVSATGFVEVFVKGSIDGSDFSSDTADRKIGTIGVVANATTYKGVFSIAQALGGKVTPFWQIRIRNASGAALNATASNHSVAYRGIQIQSV